MSPPRTALPRLALATLALLLAVTAAAPAADAPSPPADSGAAKPAPAAAPTATVGAAQIQRSQLELQRIRTRIEAVAAALNQDQGQQDALRSEVEAADRQVARAAGELRGVRQKLEDQEAVVARAREDRNAAERSLAQQRAGLARQIRAAFMIGQRGRTKLMLNQDRLQKLSRVMTYYDYLNRLRADRIRGILGQVQRLRGVQQALDAQNAQLTALQSQQEGALKNLESSRQDRNRALARLDARIRNETAELTQLRGNEQELQKLLQSLRDALADIPMNLGKSQAFAKKKGRLPWPVHGRVLAAFGMAKAGGKLKWQGLWIAGSEGDPVKAVARGRVAYVGFMHTYGLIVVLEHDGGFYTLYGHNQATSVTAGEWVNPGQPIATVGSSGGHDKSGLYFELRKGTAPINPRGWLAG